jgi:propanol-preferring alcohol dehydrogenase
MIDHNADGKVMKAWVIDGVMSRGSGAPIIRLIELAEPEPEAGKVKLRVHACGICQTEPDEIEGRTPPSCYPMVPGHQVVGTVSAVGRDVDASLIGQRVGVAWNLGVDRLTWAGFRC